ncbi:alkyl/aryl-sulfatase [Hungatella hathewayi]|uniref:alkyl/aryl-sulfatase n=1 Tax=Hungatella hathewayi TaxID=154046 RepID=UPI00210E1349|nr:alkyl/aryl-sulfatase [Hungatella hathewayi]MCQ5383756.1 alkyl/aryl-sulfatase [Hungatella hathewayi]
MLSNDAETRLREFNDTAFPKEIITITDRVRIAVGWGHSNCIIVEGDTSLILIDTLDSDARAARLRDELSRLTDKPVKTIIYTHGHPDHRGGGGAFRDTVEEIIAFAPKKAVLKGTDRINPILNKRTFRQFGYGLTDEELITQGLGIREGHAIGDGVYSFLPPATLYTEDSVIRTIDGVTFEMVSAVGETDDQIFLWLPGERIMCCGDNYYGCWPNLYAIRGGQYRDIAAWVDSLERIRSYPADALLPGHMLPVLGRERISEVLGNYQEAIRYVLDETLSCISQGLSQDETAARVVLPERYRNLPYLQEYYGTVQWSVRAIYQGYVGWFDGNPSNLNRTAPEEYSRRLVELAGGEQAVSEAVKKALTESEFQWAAELCDLLLGAGDAVSKDAGDNARRWKAGSLRELARLETSANGRHYYLSCAKELDTE